MHRKIYHGSEKIIEHPKYGSGKKYNDYGLGFYCTDSLDMAKEWGVSRDKNGYANQYEIDCSNLLILDLNDEQYTILHWLTILLENREFDIPSGLALEAKKYLKRERSKEDERNLYITLTEEGIALKDKALYIPYEMTKLLDMSKEEKTELYHLLYRLLECLKERDE